MGSSLSLQKILWICAGIATLIVGAGSGVHWVLSAALFFIAAVPTVRFIAAKSELAGGRVAIGVLAACVAVGFFLSARPATRLYRIRGMDVVFDCIR